MLKQVLLDQLSQFLIVEQGRLELYRVATSRAIDPELKARYVAFGRDTARHRQVLVRLIERLGGDPDYISPTARGAQFKAAKLLESAMVVDGMSDQEIMLSDLENVLLSETKCQADWALLRRMVEHARKDGFAGLMEKAGSMAGAGLTTATGGPGEQVDTDLLAEALTEAVEEVGDKNDEHLAWAREKHIQMSLRMGMLGPAPSPERWQHTITNPDVAITDVHPAVHTEGLLEGVDLPQWLPSPVTRSMRKG